MGDLSPSERDSIAGPLPLITAVTGHRDLRQQDISELTRCTREVFEEIKREYPHTPLVLLSLLADGADRLVAGIAKDEFAARLVVPLPMPRELYERDFNETSLLEFKKLIDGAEWFELPLIEGNTKETIQERGAHRNKQYALGGRYIAQHSQILIALWDGKASEEVGGTAQIVEHKLQGVPEKHGNLPDPVESGYVYHIRTPRRDKPGPARPARKVKLFPKGFENLGQVETSYREIYALVDKFNEDAIDLTPKLGSVLEASRRELLPDDAQNPLPSAARFMRERYAVADTLAIHFRRKMVSALKWLHILVFGAAFFFELFAHLNHFLPTVREIPWSLFLYVAVLLAAYVWIYDRAKRKDYQNKYQDHRALAEGMRVQFFWNLAGINDSVTEHYLRKQRSEIRWIRLAIRIWNFLASIQCKARGAAPIVNHQMQPVIDRWVIDQYDFFKTTSCGEKEELERFERDVARLLWFGLGLAILTFVLYLLKSLLHDLNLSDWAHDCGIEFIVKPTEEDSLAHDVIIVLMGLAPVAAALLHNYAHKKALSEHVKQFRRMMIIFDKSREKLQTLVDYARYPEAQVLIRELGEEALMENGDWLHLHRERPLEVPHG